MTHSECYCVYMEMDDGDGTQQPKVWVYQYTIQIHSRSLEVEKARHRTERQNAFFQIPETNRTRLGTLSKNKTRDMLKHKLMNI